MVGIDFAPIGTNSGGDVSFTMYAGDGNEFRMQVQLTPITSCGPAELRIYATDDSGNTGTTIGQIRMTTLLPGHNSLLCHGRDC